MPAEARIKPRGKVFRDPVHRLIRIDPGDDFILDLIDTPVFQRLRRIRQLGVSWLTYHGAEHSRFAHSLGVFNFAQRILRSLRERYREEKAIVSYLDSHAKELKAAALLHDIGHGPFSHMLERAFDDSPDHEDRSIKLIQSNESTIGQLLGDWDIDPTKVAEIIQKTSKDRLLVDIVSSQLDADRMDYLLRDSLHTGVEYGRYDAEWVVRNLCIGVDPGAQKVGVNGTDYTRHRLCLDRSRGLHSAEQLILARLHMTMQVYMHRVTRGFEVLLLNLFQEAARIATHEELPSDTPSVVKEFFANKGDLNEKAWLRFDETAMFTAFSIWADAEGDALQNLRRMSDAFLRRKRIYRSREIPPNRIDFTWSRKLGNDLNAQATEGIDWQLDQAEMMPYKGILYAASRPKGDFEEQSAESILLSSGDVSDTAVAVDTESKIFRTLDFEGQKVCRVYYDRIKAVEIEKVLDAHGVTG